MTYLYPKRLRQGTFYMMATVQILPVVICETPIPNSCGGHMNCEFFTFIATEDPDLRSFKHLCPENSNLASFHQGGIDLTTQAEMIYRHHTISKI